MKQKSFRVAEKFWVFWKGILDALHDDDACIVVEGVNDMHILLNLLVPRDRIVIIGDMPINRVAEEISRRYRIAYIFTDLDRAGELKASRLRIFLQDYGVRVIDLRRCFLRVLNRFGFKSLGKIEELKRFSLLLPRPNRIILGGLKKKITVSYQ